ncbi:MAG: Cof-type HAD-IIB family hydrolase [Clostridia bacterium]|nr:Cof-type HAD-IIB family hydrolase [Clostridia bacterium]
MGIFSGCLLASDIDGTLMNNGYINPKNIERIKYFVENGGCFVLCTGRSLGAINMVIEKIDCISYAIVLNGCAIYDFNKNKPVFENFVPEKDYKIAEHVIQSGINVGIEAHVSGEVFNLKVTQETIDHQAYEWLKSKDVSFKEACKYKWNKVLYAFDNAEDAEKIKKLISEQKTDCFFLDTCAVIDGHLRNYYEQLPKGVSKDKALLQLAKLLGIKRERVFAAGDYFNDIEMLKTAHVSAVPMDSPDEVKQCADYLTVSCDDGAVADFIDYLGKLLS